MITRRDTLRLFGTAGLVYLTQRGCNTFLDAMLSPKPTRGPAADAIRQRYGIQVVGYTTQEELDNLDEALNETSRTLDNFDKQIPMCTSIELPSSSVPYRNIAAHIDNEDKHRIDFIEQPNAKYMVHELAHLWHFATPAITNDWNVLADIEYGTLGNIWFWNDGTKEPANGCINPYGGTDIREDIATFALAAYVTKRQLERGERPTRLPHDDRYGQKLDLLAEHEFISLNEYAMVRPFFRRDSA